MAGKKASELGDRFRNVAMREDRGSPGALPASPPTAAPAEAPEGTEGAAPTATDAAATGRGAPPGVSRRGYGAPRQKSVGRKARVGLRPGTGRHRFTLDLDGVQHRYLKQLALDAGTDMASVVRVLITSLEEDPVLRNEVAMRARGDDDGASVYGR
jgi:hypothetical protein